MGSGATKVSSFCGYTNIWLDPLLTPDLARLNSKNCLHISPALNGISFFFKGRIIALTRAEGKAIAPFLVGI